MGTLIAFLMTKGLSQRAAGLIAYASAALLLLGTVTTLVLVYNHHVISAHEAKIEQRAKPATDQAATERAADTINNAKSEQEMHNAIAAQPDQPIAPTSHALSCERLRRAGRHPASCG